MSPTLKSLRVPRRLAWRWVVVALILVRLGVFADGDKPPVVPENLRNHVHPAVRYERVALSENENAFVVWERAIEEFKKIEHSKLRKDFRADQDEFSLKDTELWLQENETALALLDKGIARKKCQFPAPDRGYHTIVGYLYQLIGLADVKLLRARVMMRKGRYEEAAEELVGLLTMGEMVSGGDGGLPGQWCGWAIDRRTTQGIVALTRTPGVNPPVFHRLISAASFSHDPNEVFRESLRLEMECFLLLTAEWPDDLTNATETEIVMGRPPKGMEPPKVSEAAQTNTFQIVLLEMKAVSYHKALLSKHPNALDKPATVEFFSEYLTQLLKEVEVPVTKRETNNACNDRLAACRNESNHYWESIPAIKSNRVYFFHLAGDGLVKAQLALAQIDNPVGKEIILRMVDAFEHPWSKYPFPVVERIAAWRVGREAVRTLVAVRLFWDQNRKLPNALEDLVKSNILQSVPIDPYSGEPLQYSKQGQLIWSMAKEKYAEKRYSEVYDIKFSWNIILPSSDFKDTLN